MNLFLTVFILTISCTDTVGIIIEHEVGNIPSSYNFVYNQIIYDLNTIPCNELTNSRWAIKSFPKPREAILKVIRENKLIYPKCQFIVNLQGIKDLNSYGYKTRIDYKFTSGPFTVVGVNCENRYLAIFNKISRLEAEFR